MSDPAISATIRAWDAIAEVGRDGSLLNSWAVAKRSAREALTPIRKLHYKLQNHDLCATCWRDNQPWPCETAKWIYTPEELP